MVSLNSLEPLHLRVDIVLADNGTNHIYPALKTTCATSANLDIAPRFSEHTNFIEPFFVTEWPITVKAIVLNSIVEFCQNSDH